MLRKGKNIVNVPSIKSSVENGTGTIAENIAENAE